MGSRGSLEEKVEENGGSLPQKHILATLDTVNHENVGIICHVSESIDSSGLKNYGIIPDLVVSNIALFLPLEDLKRYFISCRLFHNIANSNRFWYLYYQSMYLSENKKEMDPKYDDSTNWKESFYIRFVHSEYRYIKKYPILEEEELEDPRIRQYNTSFLGDVGSGKTTFLYRLRHGRFCDDVSHINARESFGKVYRTKNFKIRLQLFDTTCMEMTTILADIIFVCFAINDRETFNVIGLYIDEIKRLCGTQENYPVVVLVGMKKDKEEEEREVSIKDAIEFVFENKKFVHGYVENSSIDPGTNVMVTIGIAIDLVVKRKPKFFRGVKV